MQGLKTLLSLKPTELEKVTGKSAEEKVTDLDFTVEISGAVTSVLTLLTGSLT